jgi:phosphomannomutase
MKLLKMINDIKFGTDGWRGIMDGNDFTVPKVKLVTQAICNHLKKIEMAEKGIIIGYDTRENSYSFAKACAEVASANGVTVFITERAVPTPLTAYAISVYDAAGALMITASHNPSQYNGIKFIPHYCGPATDEITDSIEEELSKLEADGFKSINFKNNLLVNIINPIPEYLEKLRDLTDLDLLRSSNLSVVVDSMHGASCGIIDKVFIDSGVNIETIRGCQDPFFGGDVPEPIAKHLVELTKKAKNESKLGLALDGDADRFGAVDEKGIYIQANYVLALIAHYLVTVRKIKGGIARSIATTHLLDLIAEKNELPLIETKVGFKYLGQVMRDEDIVIAGEESAGLSIKGHIPEKDGLLAVILLTEITAYYKKPLSEVLDMIFEEYGYMKSKRIDIDLSAEKKESLIKDIMSNPPKSIDDLKVTDISEIDGLRLKMDDGSWVLIRPSGTEPKVRTYIEAPGEESFKKLETFANSLIHD